MRQAKLEGRKVTQPTRRDFVKVAAVGTTLAVRPIAGYTMAKGGTEVERSAVSRLRVWITDDDRRLARTSAIVSDSTAGLFSLPKITVDAGKQFQPVFGFGAEFTDTACYLLNQLPDQSRAELFHDLFHPTEMGLNFCRVVMGARPPYRLAGKRQRSGPLRLQNDCGFCGSCDYKCGRATHLQRGTR
jgi:hypothetical protein